MAIVCFASNSFGQTGKLQLPPLSFHKASIKHYSLFSVHAPSLIAVHRSVAQNVHSFGSYVHYPAIFCQMEQKSVNRLGVMIQVHAGDYNSYSRRR